MDVGRPAQVWATPSGSSYGSHSSRKVRSSLLPLSWFTLLLLLPPLTSEPAFPGSLGTLQVWGARLGLLRSQPCELSNYQVLSLSRASWLLLVFLTLSGFNKLFNIWVFILWLCTFKEPSLIIDTSDWKGFQLFPKDTVLTSESGLALNSSW